LYKTYLLVPKFGICCPGLICHKSDISSGVARILCQGAQVWRREKTKIINVCLTTSGSTLYTPEYALLH